MSDRLLTAHEVRDGLIKSQQLKPSEIIELLQVDDEELDALLVKILKELDYEHKGIDDERRVYEAPTSFIRE